MHDSIDCQHCFQPPYVLDSESIQLFNKVLHLMVSYFVLFHESALFGKENVFYMVSLNVIDIWSFITFSSKYVASNLI